MTGFQIDDKPHEKKIYVQATKSRLVVMYPLEEEYTASALIEAAIEHYPQAIRILVSVK